MTNLRVAEGWPWWAQLVVAFVAIDFIQWSIHNLLHRVPALWEVHKVHHSIQTMDFWGSMRFHFGEILVYKSLQYMPLALLGFDGRALFVLAVASTAIVAIVAVGVACRGAARSTVGARGSVGVGHARARA